jgi:ferredoxin hydrogenase
LAWLIKSKGIDFLTLPDEDYDAPMGVYSGAGQIFGVTGGVMEAAIRTGYELITGQAIPQIDVTPVRGIDGFRTAALQVGDLVLKVGVVTGLAHVEPVMEALKEGKLDLHFVEVMTCPEGCVTGGGQPKLLLDTDREAAYARRRTATFVHDETLPVRKSHQNPAVTKLYEDFLEKPNGNKSHTLLHTTYCGDPKGHHH